MIRFFSGVLLFLSVLDAHSQNRAEIIRKVLLDASSETVLVASHRASHREYPENSIPAIKDAIRLGVDILEIDVKITADGVPILMHDRTIDRTTTGKGDPEKITWKELRKLSLVVDGQPTNQRIPTLEEALLAIKGHALIDLDMKTDAVQPVLDVVRKTGTEDIVVFFDSDREVLKLVQKSGDFLVMPRARNKSTTEEVLHLFSPPVVHIDPSFNTPDVIQLIKSGNARVWINTLGATDQLIAGGQGIEALSPLVATGINIIQTDQPQLLLGLLNQLEKRPDLPPVLSSPTRPLITAHRSKIALKSVENTTEGMEQALRLGVDFIEIDVRTTKDGHIVILHDETIDRTTHSSGKVDQLTLKVLEAVSLKKAGNQKIPTLEEAARFLSGWNNKSEKKTQLYVDCKNVSPDQLVSILKKHNLHREAVFYGSDEFLLSLKSVYSDARIMPALRSMEELPIKAAKLYPYAFDMHWKIADPASIKLVHGYHIKVFCDLLAANDVKKNFRKAKDLGVDAIQTNKAGKAKKTLR